jgi:hypothetical protein
MEEAGGVVKIIKTIINFSVCHYTPCFWIFGGELLTRLGPDAGCRAIEDYYYYYYYYIIIKE